MSKIKASKIVLGVTGGIATGKSTVMKILAEMGVSGISSDPIAHKAIARGSGIYRKIVKRYGYVVLDKNRNIDRQELGKIVFKNPKERGWLETQVHPVVVRELKRFVASHQGLLALDIPLLFEAKLERLVDKIILITAPSAFQVRRLQKRNGFTAAEARRRISAQMPESKKKAASDFVIPNNRDIALLRQRIGAVLRELMNKRAIASPRKRLP